MFVISANNCISPFLRLPGVDCVGTAHRRRKKEKEKEEEEEARGALTFGDPVAVAVEDNFRERENKETFV